MKYNGRITPQGVLVISNRKLFDESIRCLSSKSDVDVTIEVKKRKKHRSDLQNRYYFGVVVHLITDRLRELGHEVDKDDTHNFLKGKFLYSELVNEASGEIERIPKKTPDCTTIEFIEYMEDCKRWAAQFLDIYIPDPNTQIEIE